MKRRVIYHIILLPLLLGSCGDQPTSTESMGRIVLEVRYGQESAAKSAAAQAVDRMVARVIQEGTLVVQQDLQREGSRWQGEIEVDAGSYVVELEAYKFSKVTWRGNAWVSVQARKTTTASLRMYLTNTVVEARFGFNSADEIAGWSENEISGSWQVMNGHLLVTGDSTGYFEVGPENTFSGDIEISVLTEWMDGIDNHFYGVSFHVTEDGGYEFGIAGDGHYSFWEWDDSSAPFVPLIDWTYSSVVNKRGRNTLRVVTSGPRFMLSINDTRVGTVVDSTYTQGIIGLGVGSSQQVVFDNLFIMGTIVATPIVRKKGIYQAQERGKSAPERVEGGEINGFPFFQPK